MKWTAVPFLFLLFPTGIQAGTGSTAVPSVKVLSAGKVEYRLDASKLDPTAASFLQGMTMTAYFEGDKLRMELNMGMLGTTTTILNGPSKSSLILLNLMGNKLAVTEMPESNAPEWKVIPTNETRDIAGYTCRKTLLQSESGDLEFYVTDQIHNPRVKSDLQLHHLNGFPLQIQLSGGVGSLLLVATKVTGMPIESSRFTTTVPSGYDLITPDQMVEMFGGMMGY